MRLLFGLVRVVATLVLSEPSFPGEVYASSAGKEQLPAVIARVGGISMKATAAAFLALVLALPMAALAGQDEVIITTTQLEPRVLQTTTAQRVIFVNRSGRPVHVEFKGSAAGHNVFQVADRIWAQFHTAGPHLYVVHFSDGRTRELRGVVEVRHVPERGGELPTCRGISVEGICLVP